MKPAVELTLGVVRTHCLYCACKCLNSRCEVCKQFVSWDENPSEIVFEPATIGEKMKYDLGRAV